ncbi:hypothetical protein EOA27_02935 [Mesorhizobium sp. M2A.F.Ca.ET.037.01.1.1]|nr:hypothetical protein EOA27_02935 [Mesorhizobium sp. M2A.F.Ca.ET.037.01.1.1]RUY01768.1 hypothetical protein EOA25_22445 [Mesorhizobium sp. M2A.F.Ca.ET.040.01.1.1]RWA85428.1 MAG: hypothetical protein EOQ31_26630 [Mesorhizobium sp.]RWX65910.1 hypothetical protein EOA24_19575 [Mesorhizobium sp. M2A.F.Ca.ET.039.01.1.1]RWB44551.1 MAG: hypothetical protein EOQ44_15605 [Mesorhizobium sp.]
MGKYVAVAMMIAVATGPAAALDVGGSGKVGGVGVGAGVSAGSQGVSAGVGASFGGAGGASVGASAGTGGVSVGASASAGGTSVGASAKADTGSVGAGVSVGSAPDSASAGVSTGAGTATSGTTVAAPPDDPSVLSAKSATTAIGLPSTLKPSSNGAGEFGRSTAGYPFAPLLSLKAKPGTPTNVVSACRAAIGSAATPLGAVRVYAVSAGPMRQRKAGLAAPIEVRITYALRDGVQVRQAKVLCRLSATGKVIAVT